LAGKAKRVPNTEQWCPGPLVNAGRLPRGPKWMGPARGGDGCTGVRFGRDDERSCRAVERAMSAAGDRRFCLLFPPEKSKPPSGGGTPGC